MSHYVLTFDGNVFARGSLEDMQKAQKMHQTSKGKLNGASMTIAPDPRDYPFQNNDHMKK